MCGSISGTGTAGQDTGLRTGIRQTIAVQSGTDCYSIQGTGDRDVFLRIQTSALCRAESQYFFRADHRQ